MSQDVLPPMPFNHSGSATLVVGHEGSTVAGEIIEISQKVSGPTVIRRPDDRKALKTPTFPEAAAPGQAVVCGRSGS